MTLLIRDLIFPIGSEIWIIEDANFLAHSLYKENLCINKAYKNAKYNLHVHKGTVEAPTVVRLWVPSSLQGPLMSGEHIINI